MRRGSRTYQSVARLLAECLSDIPQITPKFREIVPSFHRQGNCIPSAAIVGLILEIGPRLEGHLYRFFAIQTHPACRFHVAADFPGLRRSKSWSQIIDPPQNFPKQVPGHGDFGQFERNVATMPDDLRADLDQLLPQRGQRPMLHLLG